MSVVWEGSQFVHHSLALINRELCLKLIEAGHELSILPYEPDQFGADIDSRFDGLARRFRISLSRPADVHVRHQWPLNPHPPGEGRWVIIQPWEFGSIPQDWVPLLRDQVDELWVPSSFVREGYLKSGIPPAKVVVVPNGVDPDRFSPTAAPLSIPTQKSFKFLFVGGTIGRKGPDLALNAYLKCFTAADDVCLVVKDFGTQTVYQGHNLEAKIRELQTRPNVPEILYMDENLPPDKLPGLFRACDCLLHPYRGEGFGLPILEAMACGLPVIITAGGAADDFTSDEIAYRIPSSRRSIGNRVGEIILTGEGWLLEPDFGALAERMLFVFRHRAEAHAVGLQASEYVRRNWTWEMAAAKAEERLMALAARTDQPLRHRVVASVSSSDSSSNRTRRDEAGPWSPSPCPSPQGEGHTNAVSANPQTLLPDPRQRTALPLPSDGRGEPTVESRRDEPNILKSEIRNQKSEIRLIWEGDQFAHHSFALINRELCSILINRGYEVSIRGSSNDQFGAETDARFRELKDRFDRPLSAAATVHVRHRWPLDLARPKQGYWVVIQPWEFGMLPKAWVEVLRDKVDEVWAYTSFVRDTYIRSGIPASKVFVVPAGMNPKEFHPDVPRMSLPTTKKFKFLFVGGTIRRKGPDILLNAYLNLFKSSDDVCLVIKDFGGQSFYQGVTLEAKIREFQSDPGKPEILYINENFPPNSLPGLYTACDCLVHPYRGEGFGLPVLEAMACGLPVIVTAGGATDDFVTDDYGYCIPSARKSLGTEVDGVELAGEGFLLEPNLPALVSQMAAVFVCQDGARRLGRKASQYVRANWTWERAASIAEERLRALAARADKPPDNPRQRTALPLPAGERTTDADSDGPRAAKDDPRQRFALPLPAGEGRGEGEGRVQSAQSLPECSTVGGSRSGGACLEMTDGRRPMAESDQSLLASAATISQTGPRGSETEKASPQSPIEIPRAGRLGSLKKAQDLAANKKYLKAWKAALEAIKLRPFHPDAYLQMTDIALSAGDERHAFLCAERLLRMTPNWEMARKVYASLKPAAKGRRSQIQWTPLPPWLEKPRLSVCLIAKDEEEHLGRCLASVKPIAYQIVVVDTGSTDRTIEIARQFGAEVHHFAWNDNFADARNAAHEQARGDWVLILDADEELPPESHDSLARDMAAANVLGYRIPICNIHEAVDSVTYVPRLFRNAPALFFVGRVHEQIYASVIARKAEWGMDAELGTAKILHYGYDPGLVKRRQKIQRNLRLMERAVQELPNEAALLMNYGLDLVNDGRLEEGLEKYRQAYRVMEPHSAASILPEVRERLLTLYGVHALKAERFEEVLHIMTSRLATDAGPTASLHFLAAVALMKLNRPAEAVAHLESCLAKRELPTLTPPCHQIFNAGPDHLLAQCLVQTGQTENAELHFKRALEYEPNSAGMLHDYAHFLHRTNRSLEALQVLHGVMAKGINEPHIWHLGSFIANSKPEFVEFAVDWTREALKHFPEHEGIKFLRGEALFKAGQFRDALPFFENSPHVHEPSPRAAVLFCQLAEGQTLTPVPPDQEFMVSKEFVGWYRRLLATQSREALKKINARLDALRIALPTAATMLEQALREADAS
ncbi:MAG: glycosyltransferase [Verrucomicrobia bacterium]|nr:glycosyltransferase [Verrucomicrobiota bacterium]